MAARET